MNAPEPGVPELSASEVCWVTVEEMAEVDRVMVDELGVALLQMMENAGRNLAVLVRHRMGGSATGRRVHVLAGTGGNGGGGLAAARHLLVAGADVAVTMPRAPREGSATATQLASLRRLGAPVRTDGDVEGREADLVLDALLGYGQQGAPDAEIAALAGLAEGRPTVALDTPSGLELVTGRTHEPTVRAEATMTLAAPKTGLDTHPAHVGSLYLADISVPASVLATVTGRAASSPFGHGPLVRLLG